MCNCFLILFHVSHACWWVHRATKDCNSKLSRFNATPIPIHFISFVLLTLEFISTYPLRDLCASYSYFLAWKENDLSLSILCTFLIPACKFCVKATMPSCSLHKCREVPKHDLANSYSMLCKQQLCAKGIHPSLSCQSWCSKGGLSQAFLVNFVSDGLCPLQCFTICPDTKGIPLWSRITG